MHPIIHPHRDLMVQVVGYTSATGSGGHNQALGVRRAAVITDFIRQDAANNGW